MECFLSTHFLPAMGYLMNEIVKATYIDFICYKSKLVLYCFRYSLAVPGDDPYEYIDLTNSTNSWTNNNFLVRYGIFDDADRDEPRY
jgi:hypothetical protein